MNGAEAIVVSDAMMVQFIGQYLWPFIRIGAFFFAMPVIGAATVPPRVRLALAFATTLVVAPILPAPPPVDLVSLPAMLMIIREVLIGLAMGFVLQVLMHVFVLAGQFIAMKMGLGFAAMNDPSGVSVTVLSQFYLLLATLLFLAVDGHLIVIELMVTSFSTLPVGGGGLGPDDFLLVASMGSWMFTAALVIALPLFTSLLVVNMAFGAMNRSAPQMNVFTVGFPITLIFGLFLMWAGLAAILPNFDLFMQEGVRYLRLLIGAP